MDTWTHARTHVRTHACTHGHVYRHTDTGHTTQSQRETCLVPRAYCPRFSASEILARQWCCSEALVARREKECLVPHIHDAIWPPNAAELVSTASESRMYTCLQRCQDFAPTRSMGHDTAYWRLAEFLRCTDWRSEGIPKVVVQIVCRLHVLLQEEANCLEHCTLAGNQRGAQCEE